MKKPDEMMLQELQQAIEADSPARLRPLIEAGASVDQKIGPEFRTTLLEFAIEKNAINATTFLIGAGAKIDKAPNRPLIYAALFNRVEIVELLLKAGANPNVTISNPDENVRRETALMFAAENPGLIRIIELLLKNGADPNLANSKGETALRRAVDFANLEAVRRLLAAGAKPSGVVLHGLIYRCDADSLEIFKLLVAAGADLNALGTYHFRGWTLLEAAKVSYKHSVESIERLSRGRHEPLREKNLERWKADAQILQAMVNALRQVVPDTGDSSTGKA